MMNMSNIDNLQYEINKYKDGSISLSYTDYSIFKDSFIKLFNKLAQIRSFVDDDIMHSTIEKFEYCENYFKIKATTENGMLKLYCLNNNEIYDIQYMHHINWLECCNKIENIIFECLDYFKNKNSNIKQQKLNFNTAIEKYVPMEKSKKFNIL